MSIIRSFPARSSLPARARRYFRDGESAHHCEPFLKAERREIDTLCRLFSALFCPFYALSKQKRGRPFCVRPRFGVPERIRTADLPLRRRSLYPAELRKHRITVYHICLFFSIPFRKKSNIKNRPQKRHRRIFAVDMFGFS